MGVTYKVVLDKRREMSEHLYPLRVRITKDRKQNEYGIGVRVAVKYWNKATQRVKPNHPNAKKINLKLTKEINKLEGIILDLELSRDSFSLKDILDRIKGKDSTQTFNSFSKKEIEKQIANNRIGNATAYQSALNKVEEFSSNKSLKFEDIDFKFLDDFENTLIANGIKINSVAVYMKEIRAIYNKAIKAGVVQQKYYPFNDYKIKTVKTISRSLTVEELRQIINLPLDTNSAPYHQRSLFLLSFYLIGINFIDMALLEQSNIENERVRYIRQKTGKVYNISLHAKARIILDELSSKQDSEYLLPIIANSKASVIESRRIIKQRTKVCNNHLKKIAKLCEISKSISTYYARYTWANIAHSIGYSKDKIAEALGHEYGNKVTGIYLDSYSNEVIDEMNNAVINYVHKKLNKGS